MLNKSYPGLITGITEIDQIILINLDVNDLRNILLVSTDLYQVCNTKYFWTQMLKQDFHPLIEETPDNLTYIEWYRHITMYKRYGQNRYTIASKEGNLTIIKYFLHREDFSDIEDGRSPSKSRILKDMIYNATRNGHLDIIIWCFEQDYLYPSNIRDALNWAAEHEFYDVLEYFKTNRCLPGNCIATYAAKNNKIKLLNWMADINILPTTEDADLILKGNNIYLLEWLLQHNVYPSQRSINRTVFRWTIDKAVILFKYQLLPSRTALNSCARNNRIDLLKYYATLDLFPTKSAAEWIEKQIYLHTTKQANY